VSGDGRGGIRHTDLVRLLISGLPPLPEPAPNTITGTISVRPYTFEEIRARMRAHIEQQFGQAIDTGDNSIFGALINAVAERDAAMWEQLANMQAAAEPNLTWKDAR